MLWKIVAAGIVMLTETDMFNVLFGGGNLDVETCSATWNEQIVFTFGLIYFPVILSMSVKRFFHAENAYMFVDIIGPGWKSFNDFLWSIIRIHTLMFVPQAIFTSIGTFSKDANCMVEGTLGLYWMWFETLFFITVYHLLYMYSLRETTLGVQTFCAWTFILVFLLDLCSKGYGMLFPLFDPTDGGLGTSCWPG